jgi:putative transposase
VLAWRLSNTLDADFCIEALEDALAGHGRPKIFNTDQGSQFTSSGFTDILLAAGIAISMDGKGRFMDNIFVERLWRSLKYEEVYLHAYDNVAEAHIGIDRWIAFYNDERPHQALAYRTPRDVFEVAHPTPVDMMDIAEAMPTYPQAPQQPKIELVEMKKGSASTLAQA